MNILVTGGASGLGEDITRRLASNESNTIFFTFNRSIESAKVIEREFTNTKGIHCDFRNQNDLDNLLTFISVSNINILINNAYTSKIIPTHFHKTDISVFKENFLSNIIPIISINQKAIFHFRKQKFGKIITILSSAIIDKPPLGWSEYAAGKAYLASLCKSWATENSSFNITSNSVSPSFMLTNLTIDTDERTIQDIKDANPLKEHLTTKEVADTVLYLSTCSQQINGINLIINAGTHIV